VKLTTIYLVGPIYAGPFNAGPYYAKTEFGSIAIKGRF